MRAAYLLSFLNLALAAFAVPADQLVLGDVAYSDDLAAVADKAVHNVLQGAHDTAKHAKEAVNGWLDVFGRTHVMQNGIACTYHTS